MNAPERDATRRMLDDLDLTPPPAEPEHDADYWKGALKVCAERDLRIRRELSELEQRRTELEGLQRMTARMREEAVLGSRNLLSRREVAKLIGLQPKGVSAMITGAMRRRGMGAGR